MAWQDHRTQEGTVMTNNIPVKITLDISGSPIESQWGSQKYPG